MALKTIRTDLNVGARLMKVEYELEYRNVFLFWRGFTKVRGFATQELAEQAAKKISMIFIFWKINRIETYYN